MTSFSDRLYSSGFSALIVGGLSYLLFKGRFDLGAAIALVLFLMVVTFGIVYHLAAIEQKRIFVRERASVAYLKHCKIMKSIILRVVRDMYGKAKIYKAKWSELNTNLLIGRELAYSACISYEEYTSLLNMYVQEIEKKIGAKKDKHLEMSVTEDTVGADFL